ncbi:hypothetical protein KI809_06330 [Geobacter pelophilus]|uniref:Uncharacterized protein n=1 Tax=Geoanaerobacter pelophilus TaxID=60036 RepID=A0AAW4KZ45_9BACT|nr:hypothetical protein [Geoanaerobacter pelophilus]MBT0663916.1 hypothetical protein [Geoanaerobacter pelophilus]
MPERDDPISGILGIRPVSGERGRTGQERRAVRQLPKKPGKDSVDISSRARRLADIEDLLAGDENGGDGPKLLKHDD